MNVQEFEIELREQLAMVSPQLSDAQVEAVTSKLIDMRRNTDNFSVYVNRSATISEPDSREGTDQSTQNNMSDETVDQERPADQPVADERPEGVDRADDRGDDVATE